MGSTDGAEVELRDVTAGLWLWRQRHHEWRAGDDWEPEVSSFAVESRGDTVLLDPLAPRPSAHDLWTRLDEHPPTAIVVLKPDHVRDVDLFARWYGVPAHGPWLFWEGDAPRAKLEPVRPGYELPGGLQALYDGRGSMETPLYLPEQRALVFADGMTAPGGVLRVWWSPSLEERTLPALTPSRLGILGGDACGFPNGRRLTDDVVEIELLAVAGAAYQALDGSHPAFTFNPALIGVLTDGVNGNDMAFRPFFPYFAQAQSGKTHYHENQVGPRFGPV